MIVRDEEHNLPNCLRDAAEIVDDFVIVDTGSRDRTKEVAVDFGAAVFDFPWIDDFAAARNHALQHARGDWVLSLDADERLDGENQKRLRNLLDNLDENELGYLMLVKAHNNSNFVLHQIRLFRNHPQIRWESRVHEQLFPSFQRLRAEPRVSNVTIEHTGYQDPVLVQQSRRKLSTLTRSVSEEPLLADASG